MKRPSLMTESSKVEKNDGKHLILEAAMFFDEAGYKLFAPYLKNDYHRLRNMLLAYMNGVQALYHHPSIGQRLDIALVRLEIFKTQPSDLPTYNGERTELLNSFCNFNGKHNPSGDSNPGHWDIGLYISGLDFYAVEGGRRSDITMGLSAVGGVCMEKYSCVIAEFGTTNTFGKPYPSAGFSSVYVLAHEIGHNLGMHHDGSMNNCPKDGYVMSPSRSVTGGETHWSSCSAEIMKKLWSNPCLKDSPEGKIIERQKQGGDTPGVMWNAKKQCEILLRDKDANPIKKLNSRSDNNNDMCQNLECETPHRTGRYYAGPALDGTMCARDLWCIAGECVKKNSKLKQIAIKGDWSKWTEEKCTSGCILKSKGYQLKSRTCDNPEPINTDEGCEGLAFEIKLCSDESICKNVKRESAVDYATKKCSKFSKFLKQIDGAGSGLQAPHEPGRIWVACTIFCKIKEKSGPSSYYAPRVEFNDFNIDPYFPDGTWCHNDEKQNYYCQQHKCLPQDSQITSRTVSEDLHDLVQNAWPYVKVSDTPTTADFKNYELKQNEIIRYLSLDGSGQPLLKNLPDDPFPVPGEEDWSDHDYLDLNS
ncbi:A disintegrin and metalloproteinase with thrombospondin motifs adt-1-like [Lycorma delicatula]|uniref:A disintegrin and metalloproteinase with thrombospondin motifs adt-1-like n=1 Tax=Lycorma delicatula TaxID=130591 RepID=UPI003F50FF10